MATAMLAKMRASAQNRYLTERCLIERSEQMNGDYMTPSENWLVVAAAQPCRVLTAGQQATGAVQEVGETPALEDLYKLALPYDTNIQADDRITIQGVQYQIVRLDDALTERFFKQALICRYRGML